MGDSRLDVTRVAQTNVALYRQMHRAGYERDALLLVRDAYELATELFTGRYRPSGKPFVCHLVGTASVLASLEATPEVAAAGMLHAAYDTNQHTGTVTANRQRVGDALGPVVEHQVHAYRELAWNVTSVRGILDAGLTPTHPDAPTLLMRLANEIDDHLDLSMAYCSSRRRQIDAGFPCWIEMAERLDRPALADAFRALAAEDSDSEWILPLSYARGGSYAIGSPRPGWPRRVLKKLRSMRGGSGRHIAA
jgi:uncharacterized protein DUF6817